MLRHTNVEKSDGADSQYGVALKPVVRLRCQASQCSPQQHRLQESGTWTLYTISTRFLRATSSLR